MTIAIRAANRDDFAAVTPLWYEIDLQHHQALPEFFRAPAAQPRDIAMLDALLADPAQTLLVAERDGGIVGRVEVACRIPPPAFVAPMIGVVDAIVVTASARGASGGRALLEAAHAWAASQGATEMTLSVWAFNHDAIAVYEHLGYETINYRMWLTDLTPGTERRITPDHAGL